jgi:hypothetical protein
MTFVPSQESYWFAHDCADVVAEWLVELDCRVSWLLVRLGFTVPATR